MNIIWQISSLKIQNVQSRLLSEKSAYEVLSLEDLCWWAALELKQHLWLWSITTNNSVHHICIENAVPHTRKENGTYLEYGAFIVRRTARKKISSVVFFDLFLTFFSCVPYPVIPYEKYVYTKVTFLIHACIWQQIVYALIVKGNKRSHQSSSYLSHAFLPSISPSWACFWTSYLPANFLSEAILVFIAGLNQNVLACIVRPSIARKLVDMRNLNESL